MGEPGGAYSLGLPKTWGSGVLSSTRFLGGSKDDLKVPVAHGQGAGPSVQREQWLGPVALSCRRFKVSTLGGHRGNAQQEGGPCLSALPKSSFRFRATPAADGGSPARGPIEAAAAGLRHSHSSARSKSHLQARPQLAAAPDP